MLKLVHHAKCALDVGKHKHCTATAQHIQIRMQQYLKFIDGKINMFHFKIRDQSQKLFAIAILGIDAGLHDDIVNIDNDIYELENINFYHVKPYDLFLYYHHFTNNCFLLKSMLRCFYSLKTLRFSLSLCMVNKRLAATFAKYTQKISFDFIGFYLFLPSIRSLKPIRK